MTAATWQRVGEGRTGGDTVQCGFVEKEEKIVIKIKLRLVMNDLKIISRNGIYLFLITVLLEKIYHF